MNLDLYLTAHKKIKTAKFLKLLEENIRVNLCDFGLGNSSLDTTPKAKAMKEKIRVEDTRGCKLEGLSKVHLKGSVQTLSIFVY